MKQNSILLILGFLYLQLNTQNIKVYHGNYEANVVGTAQEPVEVTDQTLKISALKDAVLYYGFAEGDKILFNFQEADKKELKEMEIVEYPNNSKFSDFKTNKVENKTFTVTRKSIYVFRFKNGAITGRICKIKISRIPASEATRNFNTEVSWRTVNDTTFTTEDERYLIKSDTVVSNLTDQMTKVHSQGYGNRTTTNFELPKNTVAWSYYIDVNQAGQQALKKATEDLTKNAGSLVSKIPGANGVMGQIALGGADYLTQVKGKESIEYYIVDGSNASLFNAGQQFNYIKTSKVSMDFSRMTSPVEGQVYFCLINQNMFLSIDVNIKLTAIVVNNEWGKKQIQKQHVSSRQEAYIK
jgi:hypothetical protein